MYLISNLHDKTNKQNFHLSFSFFGGSEKKSSNLPSDGNGTVSLSV